MPPAAHGGVEHLQDHVAESRQRDGEGWKSAGVGLNNGTGGWYTFSKTTVNYEVINGNYGNTVVNQTGTGAKKLSMPFVGGNALPYEIIRRPPRGRRHHLGAGLIARIQHGTDSRAVERRSIGISVPGTGDADADNVRLANVSGAGDGNGGNIYQPLWNPDDRGQLPLGVPGGHLSALLRRRLERGSLPGPVSGSSTANLNGTDNILDWPFAPAAWYGNAKNTSPRSRGSSRRAP